jgi:hypothetical protein
MPDVGHKVARLAELGTVLMTFPVDRKPDGFEGDWPDSPVRLAAIAWAGPDKKLTVEPVGDLITVQL